jgi:cytoskeletal protein RodZ
MGTAPTSSLGEFLRHERENRGFTVEQVASATKISLKLLHALENDLYEELPAKPFVRGFVIAYCRFLGLNAQETLTRFSRFLEEQSSQRPTRDAGHSGYAFERREGDQARTGLWILMGVLAAAGIAVILVAKPSLKSHRRSHVDRLREAQQGVALPPGSTDAPEPVPSLSPSPSPSAKSSPAPVASPSPIPTSSPSPIQSTRPQPAPTASPSPVVSGGPARREDPLLSGKDLFKEEIRVRVVIKANRDMWVKFKVDSKDTNRIVLREGIILVLLGREAVAFQSSNPEDAVITRSVGEPNALKALGGAPTLQGLLKARSGVTDDGRTLWVPAQALETQGNPFAGQAQMAPPPPKAQPSASETPAANP